MNEIEQIAQERFGLLPEIVQETITNSNWPEKVRLICKKHGLLLDQASLIENLTLMTMVGVFDPRNLVSEISHEDIPREKAVLIIEDLEKEIFSRIKTDLINTFEGFEKADQEQEDDNELDLETESVPEEIPTESRDEILSQIETESAIKPNNDSFAIKDSFVPQIQTTGTKTEPTVAPENKTETAPQNQTTSAPQNESNNFFSEQVAQEENVVIDNSKKHDPYREPIE